MCEYVVGFYILFGTDIRVCVGVQKVWLPKNPVRGVFCVSEIIEYCRLASGVGEWTHDI